MPHRSVAGYVREDSPLIRVEKPRRSVPITLIVDDPAPCINPLYYYRLQVDGQNYERHVPSIPFDFLQHFVNVCKARGVRGKFSILPYPAGLGSILEGWDGCDPDEIRRWLDLVRTELVPSFDITPEILTHTRALDLRTRTMFDQSEQDWMADQDLATLSEYMSAATAILREAGFISAGITQPVSFSGSRPDYAKATLEAVRQCGGPAVTFYFIDEHNEGPPFWSPEVVLLDRERGEAVVDIGNTCPEFCWFTQQPEGRQAGETADRFITADGTAGRFIELIAGDAWLITVCHWQSIFSDGTRAGLLALDEAYARLARHVGPRLLWVTTSEIAHYQAATAACEITSRKVDGGVEIELDAAIPCPNFTFSVVLPGDTSWNCVEVTREEGAGQSAETFAQVHDETVLLDPWTWRRERAGIALCVPLQRGRQRLRLL
jgi:hypothetical protein